MAEDAGSFDDFTGQWVGGTPANNSGTTNASGGGAVQNNVWDTIAGGLKTLGGSSVVQGLVSGYRDIQVARTRATPSGSTVGIINPFPGTQSPYPQADAKGLVAGNTPLGGFALSLPILGIIALILFLALRGR